MLRIILSKVQDFALVEFREMPVSEFSGTLVIGPVLEYTVHSPSNLVSSLKLVSVHSVFTSGYC